VNARVAQKRARRSMLHRGVVELECVSQYHALFVSTMQYLHALCSIEWRVSLWAQVGETLRPGHPTGGRSLCPSGAAIRYVMGSERCRRRRTRRRQVTTAAWHYSRNRSFDLRAPAPPHAEYATKQFVAQKKTSRAVSQNRSGASSGH
jgi:hypothetical protein